MTIQIKVTNADSRETAIVRVFTLNDGVKSVMPIVNRPPVAELKGGQSTLVHVYDGQSVLVEERQNG